MQITNLPPLEVSDEAFYLDENPRSAAWLGVGEEEVDADELKSDEACLGRVEHRS